MKKVRSLILLIFILVVCIALLLYTKHSNASRPLEAADTAASKKLSLLELTQDKVNQIDIKNGENELTFAAHNPDSWTIQNTDPKILDLDKLKAYCEGFLKVTALKQIDTPNPKDFGLVKPSKVVTYHLKDNSSVTLLFGDATPDSSNVYVQKDGNTQKAYLVSSADAASFSASLNDYLLKDLDTFDPSSLVSFKASGKSLQNFEINEESKHTAGASYLMVSPVPKAVSVDETAFTELLNSIPKLSAENFVKGNVSQLDSYGLTKPVLHLTLEVKSDKNNKLLDYIWGNKTKDGLIYFMKAGTSNVYTMKSDFLEPFLAKLNVYNLASKLIKLVNIQDVNSVEIKLDSNSYTLGIKRTGAKKSPSEKYFINNKEIPEKTFKSLYEALISISSDTVLKDQKASSETPAVTFTYFLTNHAKETVNYYPYDNQFYMTSVDSTLHVGCNIKQFKHLSELLSKALQ